MDTRSLSSRVVADARAVLAQLAEDPVIGQYVDRYREVPAPFVGRGNIRLVLIGQDPTVKREASRSSIKTVLNLDCFGALRTHVEGICRGLGLDVDEHVYATNAAKGFFTDRPTSITACDVLHASASFWLPLLRTELDHFPDAVVVSLGEPVLSMLVQDGVQGSPWLKMKHYWGYDRRWQSGARREMRAIAATQCALGRTVFPFVHQPTIRGPRAEFYRRLWDDYVSFIRREARL